MIIDFFGTRWNRTVEDTTVILPCTDQFTGKVVLCYFLQINFEKMKFTFNNQFLFGNWQVFFFIEKAHYRQR